MCCGDKKEIRAHESAQCMRAMKHMRAVRCYYTPLRSGSGIFVQNNGLGLPKLRRCFRNVSVSVRIFRSEDLEKTFLPLPSF